MRQVIWASAFAIAFFGAADGAVAQARASGTSARPGATGVQEVVVTARRTAENLQSVPIAVSSMSSEQLERRSVRTLMDVARAVPGLQFQTSAAKPAGSLLSIRGQTQVDVLLTLHPAVGVYIDGVYQPQALGMSAGLMDLERVEVLKGPQGTLFGRNTTGGAINITTKHPVLNQFRGYAEATAGEYSTFNVAGAVNIPIVEDKLAARISAQHTGHKGYGRDLGGREVNNDNTNTYRAQLLVQPTDSISLRLSGDYQEMNNHGVAVHVSAVNPFPATGALATALPLPPALLEVAAELGLTPITSPANVAAARQALASYIGFGKWHDSTGVAPEYTKYNGAGLAADLQVDLTDSVRFRSITSYRWIDYKHLIDVDGSPFLIITNPVDISDESFTQEAQLLGTIARLNWITGVYYSRDDGTDFTQSFALNRINPSNPTIFDGDVREKTYAAFAQGTYSLTDTLRLTAGGRWTQNNQRLIARNRTALGCSIDPTLLARPGLCQSVPLRAKHGDYTYLFSVDWRPIENTMLYASTSRGFLSGGNNLRGGAAASLQPFLPEVAVAYEIGAKNEFFDRRVVLNLAAYWSKLRDAQRSVVVRIPTGGITSTITNAARANIYGFEAETTALVNSNLSLSASLDYTHAKYRQFADVSGDRTGQAFPVPDWTYTLSGIYTVPVGPGNVELSADWSWQSSVNFYSNTLVPESVTQKAYGLLGARVAYILPSQKTQISLWGKNLLNKKYANAAVAYDQNLGFATKYPGDPRVIGVTIRKRFGAE